MAGNGYPSANPEVLADLILHKHGHSPGGVLAGARAWYGGMERRGKSKTAASDRKLRGGFPGGLVEYHSGSGKWKKKVSGGEVCKPGNGIVDLPTALQNV